MDKTASKDKTASIEWKVDNVCCQKQVVSPEESPRGAKKQKFEFNQHYHTRRLFSCAKEVEEEAEQEVEVVEEEARRQLNPT